MLAMLLLLLLLAPVGNAAATADASSCWQCCCRSCWLLLLVVKMFRLPVVASDSTFFCVWYSTGLLPCAALISIQKYFFFSTFPVVASCSDMQKISVFLLPVIAFDGLLLMLLHPHVALGTAFAYVRTYDVGLLSRVAPTSAVLLYVVYVRTYDILVKNVSLPLIALLWLLLAAFLCWSYIQHAGQFIFSGCLVASCSYIRKAV